MNAQGSGWGGGSRTGGSVPLPKKPRPFNYLPEKHEVKSPFPPLEKGEGERMLVQRTRRPGSSLGKEQRQHVARLKVQGLSYGQIVTETGFSLGAVRGALRAEGVTSPLGGKSKFSDAQKAEIRRIYTTGGATMKELGARYSCSPQTISRVVR